MKTQKHDEKTVAASAGSTGYFALAKRRETMPEWRAFADYFGKQNGFAPSVADSRVEELFNYYLVGAFDQSTGRHNNGGELLP